MPDTSNWFAPFSEFEYRGTMSCLAYDYDTRTWTLPAKCFGLAKTFRSRYDAHLYVLSQLDKKVGARG